MAFGMAGLFDLRRIGGALVTLGQKNKAGSIPVTLASDEDPLSVTVGASTVATAAVTAVANSASNVTLLSSNTSRRGAIIFNDDTAMTGATLYVKFGTTAATNDFTVALAPQTYLVLPQPTYTGRIDAIASAATGSARITEFTQCLPRPMTGSSPLSGRRLLCGICTPFQRRL